MSRRALHWRKVLRQSGSAERADATLPRYEVRSSGRRGTHTKSDAIGTLSMHKNVDWDKVRNEKGWREGV